MSAGSGIHHSEMNASATADVHLVQMWVLPDTDGIEPGYEQHDLNDALAGGGLVAVASGRATTARSRSTSATPRCSSVASTPASRSWSRDARTCTCSSPSATPTSTAPARSPPATRRASPTRAAHAHRRDRRAPRCWSGRRRSSVRVVAVDWSGRKQRRAARDLAGRGGRRRAGPARGRPHPRRSGRSPRGARRHRRAISSSASTSRSRCRRGSSPRRGSTTVDDLWAAAARDGDRWLRGVRAAVLGTTRPHPSRSPRAPAGHRGRDRRVRRDPPEVDVPGRRRRQRRHRLGPRLPGARPPPARRLRDLAVRRRAHAARRRGLSARLHRRGREDRHPAAGCPPRPAVPRARSGAAPAARSRATTRSTRPSPRWSWPPTATISRRSRRRKTRPRGSKAGSGCPAIRRARRGAVRPRRRCSRRCR